MIKLKSKEEEKGAHLVTESLSKSFHKGGVQIDILKEVSLEIQRGEAVAVVGPSGSGKSTFLHVVGSLDKPSSGSVFLNGKDLFEGTPAQVDERRNREIGFVFQFHHLLSDQSAVRNVAMPAFIMGMRISEALELATAKLEALGLKDRMTHRPGELSGGEQQRVAIARAMVMRPGLLLADEPTGNLDPKTARSVFEQLLEMNEEVGSTLLVVTHSRELAKMLPRRLSLVDGRFEED